MATTARQGHNITDRVIIDAINQKLRERGRSLDGRPILRIVWSSDQLEKRIGTFEDYYGHILIRRSYKALREVQKYNYCMNYWVLERLTYLDPRNKIVQEELVEARNGTYEPLYVFRGPEGEALPVSWRAVEYMLYTMEHYTPVRGNDASAFNEFQDVINSDAKHFEMVLEDEGRSELFAHETAEFLDSTQQKMWEKTNAVSRTDTQGTSSIVESATPSTP